MRSAWALAWGATGLGALVAGVALAHATPEAGPTLCMLRRVFALPCPGCGMTRAFAALARGEWGAALTFHPWAPVLAAELAAGWLVWGASLTARDRPLPRGWPARLGPLLGANLAALAALWLGRLATGTLPL